MPDLITNFSYCKTTTALIATDTVIPVDETGRLPTNAQLAAADFFMTFESTLVAGGFEVVRVVSKSATSGAGSLTVVRGLEGSTALPRATGAILKSAVTAGLLGRLPFQPRRVATYTTASLAASAREAGLVILGWGYRIYTVQTSVPARVRLYSTVAARTADLTRGVGVDPGTNSGLMLDYVTSSDALTGTLSPLADGFDGDGTPDMAIPITVDNLNGATSVVTVNFTYVRTE